MKKTLLISIFTLFISFSATKASAQTKDTASHVKTAKQQMVDSLSSQMDIIDFLNKTIHLHLISKVDTVTFKPGKLFFVFVPSIGYTLEGSWLANVSVNTSFYTADPNTTNLSTVIYGVQYTLNHQFLLPIISNIWSKNNKIDWITDWRYYKYPSDTYGLGGNTSLANADLIDYSYLRFYQEALVHFDSYYYLGGGIDYDNHFNIHELGTNEDYDSYNKGASKTISSGPIVQFMYDSRANINNPRNAFYASATYRYNTPLLGSTEEWQSLLLEFKKYIKLAPYSPNVLALWSWNTFTFGGNAPYLDLPSNGWDVYSNTGRGYIQGRFRGQNMLYDEAEYRFRITNNGLLGGVVFANAESVSQYPSNKFQYIDPGEGFGLRVKMNKYSDVNLCCDYAFGLMGSRGLFFNLGEVF